MGTVVTWSTEQHHRTYPLVLDSHRQLENMDSPCLSLLLGASVLLVLYLVHKYTYWKRKGIPTANGLVPVLGHMLPVLSGRKEFAELIHKIYNDFKNSSMVGLYKLTSPVLVVLDPGLVKNVLQTNFSNFHDNAVNFLVSEDSLLSKNPFFTTGDVWMTGRKRLTYAFSNVRLKILFTAVSGVCNKFVDFLNRRLKSTDKYEVELKYLFSKFTGEVVANAAMGIEGHCFDDQSPPLAFDRIGENIFKPSLIASVTSNLLYSVPIICKLTDFTLFPRHMDNFFRHIVKDNMEIRRKETTERTDFFQLMADLEKFQKETFDLETLTAHVLSFYADGFETSSLTLTFIGYHLSLHQDIQEKLREEVRSTISKHDGKLTFEALKEMTYMDQVMSESQRQIPVVGTLRKMCTEDFEFQGPDGLSIRVEAGTHIIIPICGLHGDPKYWTDPDTFDPERFNAERKQNIEKMTFIPFGEGPRMCVGMRMAWLQMKACLATLLKDYKLELSPKTQLPLKLSPHYFLSYPVGGVWVYITKL